MKSGPLASQLAAAPTELLLVVHLSGGVRNRSALEALLRQPVDWRRVMDFAEYHGLTSRVRYAVEQNSWISVPADASERLKLASLRLVARSLHLTSALRRLGDRFSAARIRFAVFKGPALAAALYGDLSRRTFNDIDLIVEERQRLLAEDILISEGYRARNGGHEFREAFVKYQGQYIFETDDAMVDLHWEFVPAGTPFPLDAAEIWSRLATVAIAGREFSTLGRDDQVLMLAGHGAKEGWGSLGWICDFADFAAANSDLAWMKLWERASARSQGRTVLLACLLAAELFSAPIDPRLLAIAANERGVVKRARRIVAEMVNPKATAATLGHGHGRSLALCETWRQKAAVMTAFATTRTVGDYQAWPLPPPFWWAYYFTRPLRVGWKLAIGDEG